MNKIKKKSDSFDSEMALGKRDLNNNVNTS